jgi:hypothetical protein
LSKFISEADCRDRAQNGFREISEAVAGLLQLHPNGLRNVEIAKALGLESDSSESQRNYFTWKILAAFVTQGRVEKSNDRRAVYKLKT